MPGPDFSVIIHWYWVIFPAVKSFICTRNNMCNGENLAGIYLKLDNVHKTQLMNPWRCFSIHFTSEIWRQMVGVSFSSTWHDSFRFRSRSSDSMCLYWVGMASFIHECDQQNLANFTSNYRSYETHRDDHLFIHSNEKFKIFLNKCGAKLSPKISKCFSSGCLSFTVLKVTSVYSR